MTEALQMQPIEPTINDFDRLLGARLEDFPRYREVLDTIDSIVTGMYLADISSNRAARLGLNLLEMVEDASSRSR